MEEREDRPLQVVCFRAGDETVGLDLENRKESESCLPGSLANVVSRFPRREVRHKGRNREKDYIILGKGN